MVSTDQTFANNHPNRCVVLDTASFKELSIWLRSDCPCDPIPELVGDFGTALLVVHLLQFVGNVSFALFCGRQTIKIKTPLFICIEMPSSVKASSLLSSPFLGSTTDDPFNVQIKGLRKFTKSRES
jgi:hypothetical protein